MNIDQLSQQIKQKTARLDQQIASLEARIEASQADNQPLVSELAALQELKTKLAKSGDIARRAYELQRQGSDDARIGQRRLAIGLCLFSALGLLAIAGVVLFR